MLLIGSVFTKVLMNIMNEASDADNEKKLLANVVSSSSKVKISGNGNFVGTTPKVDGTAVSNFNVKLSTPGDKVEYSIRFCNMNSQELKYDSLWEGNISCSDELGASKSCENINVASYVVVGDKKLKINDVIEKNSCIQLVVEAEFTGSVPSETIVSVNEYFLELKVK